MRKTPQSKGIKTALQAIGIISKEVGKMADEASGKKSTSCVECGGMATHYGANFCKDCANEFYRGGDGG